LFVKHDSRSDEDFVTDRDATKKLGAILNLASVADFHIDINEDILTEGAVATY
jgi:hypothetical protein